MNLPRPSTVMPQEWIWRVDTGARTLSHSRVPSTSFCLAPTKELQSRNRDKRESGRYHRLLFCSECLSKSKRTPHRKYYLSHSTWLKVRNFSIYSVSSSPWLKQVAENVILSVNGGAYWMMWVHTVESQAFSLMWRCQARIGWIFILDYNAEYQFIAQDHKHRAN